MTRAAATRPHVQVRRCIAHRGMTGRFATPRPAPRTINAGGYGFLHLAAASALRWRTGQFPCRKTAALRLPRDRMAVAAERSMEYTALSTGCRARLALLTTLGVTARFTARPGCMARRTLRGTSNLEKKPTRNPQSGKMAMLKRLLPPAFPRLSTQQVDPGSRPISAGKSPGGSSYSATHIPAVRTGSNTDVSRQLTWNIARRLMPGT